MIITIITIITMIAHTVSNIRNILSEGNYYCITAHNGSIDIVYQFMRLYAHNAFLSLRGPVVMMVRMAYILYT